LRSAKRKDAEYSEIWVDCSIFHNRRLTFSQALVLFLKEEKKLSLADIARLLSRDQRTIWTQYATATQKLGPSFYRYPETQIRLPLSRLCGRETSILEAAVLHLKGEGLRNKEIAEALGRNERTIGSLLVRIRKRGEAQ